VPDEVRKKADNVKQGSSKETLPNAWIVDFQQQNKSAVHTYNTLLRAGTAPEQARAVLPQSMYTTTVTTGTLLGWHHLYTQRIEEHTQKETQEYARAIGELMSNFFPKSWEALNDNI
jgi:thymidylate synthase (FAD)